MTNDLFLSPSCSRVVGGYQRCWAMKRCTFWLQSLVEKSWSWLKGQIEIDVWAINKLHSVRCEAVNWAAQCANLSHLDKNNKHGWRDLISNYTKQNLSISSRIGRERRIHETKFRGWQNWMKKKFDESVIRQVRSWYYEMYILRYYLRITWGARGKTNS